jgi:hypothetical protein
MGWGWGTYPWWGNYGWGYAWGPGGWAGTTGNIYREWGDRASVMNHSFGGGGGGLHRR